ncbi:hypothetical protein KDX30_26145 [Pseudomonas sp. CDFA 553]|uniref:DUF6339 family protein n=1 Tax=Pseudomonas quasicaspiana TaxID=2829821 RepID=UPI001E2FACD1|nr:DUF6339 family protein [Pseudomonas quasicaspiana]MCD5991367.1 hypothetical protein [Pseudomonas quasicaspiana]
MIRVSLLPRLKAHGVEIVFEKVRGSHVLTAEATDLVTEYASLKSSASTGGTQADNVSISIAAELRSIAVSVGFPSQSKQARSLFDQKAAIYLALNNDLKSGEALRDDVWAFMTLVLAPDLVIWRFPVKGGRATEDKENVDPLSRFKGGVRNSFQRLWVRGTVLDRGEGHMKRWELIEQLTEDAMVQIFERASIGGNRTLALALAEGWLRTASQIGRGPMENAMRSATKILRLKNQVIDLGCLSPEELDMTVSDAFSVSLA